MITDTKIFIPVLARTKASSMRNKSFFDEVRQFLPEKPWSELPAGACKVTIYFHFQWRAHADVDNLCKPTLDMVKGSLIRDDSQIKELHAYMVEMSDKTGFEIHLEPIETP